MKSTEISKKAIPTNEDITPFKNPEIEHVGDDVDEEISEDTEYSISVVPNDFNVVSLCNFLDKGKISIPFFQRAFVWNRSKASRFIESLALNLPVPQIFLYQPVKDIVKSAPLWIVDGQQRLLSIYYFSKGRFPRPRKTVEISKEMRQNKLSLPQDMLDDNSLFSDFSLYLKNSANNEKRRLHGLTFEDLEEDILIRTLRTVIIQQHDPKNSAAAFEIFDRLNTGGVNLSPQQIRSCVYESPFINALEELNFHPDWRKLYGASPSPSQRDTEVILRVLAFLDSGDEYKSSKYRFLNKFCEGMRNLPEQDLVFLHDIFLAFIRACQPVSQIFKQKGRFRIALFEGVFVASLRDCYKKRQLPNGTVDVNSVQRLANNPDFEMASQRTSMSQENVRIRLKLATELIKPL
ncbi:MAG: DUF262 domain-containing protein [Pseudohongiellaceae bacterium]